MYRIAYSKRYQKQLKKLDSNINKKITSWLTENIDGTSNPRQFGKTLTGDLSGYWRYRIGDYRIICDINDNELIVLALSVSHRKQIYKLFKRQ